MRLFFSLHSCYNEIRKNEVGSCFLRKHTFCRPLRFTTSRPVISPVSIFCTSSVRGDFFYEAGYELQRQSFDRLLLKVVLDGQVNIETEGEHFTAHAGQVVMLEQYRHATYLPDPYYLEALRRDPGDSRANNAYGLLLLRWRQFAAEGYFRAAIRRITQYNPNPSCSESFMNLGLCLRFQERENEAYDAFYKATWTAAEPETSYYHLACIDCKRGDYALALEHIDRSLVRNGHNLKTRALRGMILDSLGCSSMV